MSEAIAEGAPTPPETQTHDVERGAHAPGHEHEPSAAGSGARLVLQALFLALAVGLLVLYRNEEHFQTLSITFVSIVLEAFPFMVLGSLVGGFIEVFIPSDRIAAFFPKRRWTTVFLAAAMGMIFPVCECAVVPVVRRLLRKGLPLGCAVAYLLGGPIVNPLVGASTAVAYGFDWKIVAIRLGFGFAIAAGVGLLMELFFLRRPAVLAQSLADSDGAGCAHNHLPENGETLRGKLGAAIHHAGTDFYDIGRFLIAGAFFAALIQTLVARSVFASALDAPVISIGLMMMLAIALNLCSEADAFVAISFRTAGVPLSAQMAFMVLGPMLDIKLLIMYLKVFRKRAIVTLASLTFTVVFLSMIALELLSR